MLKILVTKLFIFFILLIALDFVIGGSIKKAYFSQNHGAYYRATYVLETAKPDIMILGSSKAVHHYISTLIQDSTKNSCYNGGRDGCFINYSNAATNCILKRYSPKILVLDVLDDEFEESSYNVHDKVSSLFPYYHDHPEIRNIVDLKSPFEKYKLMSGMYTFNTLLLPSITGTLDLSKKKGAETPLLGYLPFFDHWSGEMKIVDSRKEKLSFIKIQALKNIVDSCRVKQVKLIFIISPTYKKFVQEFNPTADLTKRIADSAHIPFWNYLEDTTFLNNRSYFEDIRHLNNSGALIFTKDIIRRLNNFSSFGEK